MARFMGGAPDQQDQVEIGVWEKEERQHRLVFTKIYQQLTGEKLDICPNSVDGYSPGRDPWSDMQRHLIARISTEWSATSIFLWLLAHSTGELQRAISEPLQDEVNHLAKFWGFSRWAFGSTFHHQLFKSIGYLLYLFRHHQQERSGSTKLKKQFDLRQDLPLVIELGFTFARVIAKLHTWDQELRPAYLVSVLGSPPQR